VRAALLVGRLLEAPPNALPLRLLELELGMLRSPTRSAVPLPALRLLLPLPRLVELGDVRFAPAAPVVPARLAEADGCARGVSPRAVPP